VSYLKIGDVLVAQGNLPEALKSYRDDNAIMERLAKSDPGGIQATARPFGFRVPPVAAPE
jgi:hypothetical protein